jgi:hypothetical protein
MNQRTESTNHDLGAGAPQANPVVRTYSPYQQHALEKIERMRRNRAEYGFRPDAEAWMLKAMDRAIYAAYLDCVNAGVGREAGSILSGGEGDLPQLADQQN